MRKRRSESLDRNVVTSAVWVHAMGLVIRNGRAYFLESYRLGGRVTSRCAATGEFALLLADFYGEIRDEREAIRRERQALHEERMVEIRQERTETQRLRERVTLADRIVGAYSKRVTEAVARALGAIGYHRHARGTWRRKRGFSVPNGLARLDIRELARLSREGELVALGELSGRLPAWLRETAAIGHGYLDDVVETCLIEQLGPGHGALHKEAVAARMAIMRDELAPAGSSPLEVLLAERAVLCWLHVQLMEYEAMAYAGDLANISDPVRARAMDRRAEVVDRRVARAQNRFVQALTALAKVRKLAVPIVINQLNVSDQAVNVAAQRVD